MLTITKPAENRVDIELSGRVDAEAMSTALDDLIAKSDDVTKGRMLYKIPEFAMPTLGAIGVELARMPKLFGLLGKFDRCAVLSDASWIRNAAEVEGALFPGIEIKSFELAETAAAEAWLAEGATGAVET
ncbi:STAS/SEC14 domain-containing protein [Roseovarius sp. D22-M7]|uniref:STAS/SEC14 domain-containing protein n=1 Tax=Roseovarius sp. D22-M7 TaxID=3127116 RepID=UPI00300FAE7D